MANTLEEWASPPCQVLQKDSSAEVSQQGSLLVVKQESLER